MPGLYYLGSYLLPVTDDRSHNAHRFKLKKKKKAVAATRPGGTLPTLDLGPDPLNQDSVAHLSLCAHHLRAPVVSTR